MKKIFKCWNVSWDQSREIFTTDKTQTTAAPVRINAGKE